MTTTLPARNKRKRGAQPGNANARRHGLYASAPSLAEEQAVRRVVHRYGTDPDLTLLRIRLDVLLRKNPANIHALREAARYIERWCEKESPLEPPDKAVFRMVIRNALVTLALRYAQPAGTNQAETPQNQVFVSEPFEAEIAPCPPALASENGGK